MSREEGASEISIIIIIAIIAIIIISVFLHVCLSVRLSACLSLKSGPIYLGFQAKFEDVFGAGNVLSACCQRPLLDTCSVTSACHATEGSTGQETGADRVHQTAVVPSDVRDDTCSPVQFVDTVLATIGA